MHGSEVRIVVQKGVEIKSNDSRTRVMIDGKEIKGIKKLVYTHEAGHIPVITLELYRKIETIDSSCIVNIENAFENK